MKKIGLIALAMMAISFTTMASKGGSEATVEPSKSKVEWVGKKVTGQHNGIIGIKNGNLSLSEDKVTGGSVTIDMTAIEVLDLKGGSKDKLTGHLNSPDFFAVEKNPESTFEITKVEEVAENPAGMNANVTGKLTIKGITNEITFPARITVTDKAVAAFADLNIDRTKWDIKYGSGSFFDGLGDKMINDDVNIKFNIAASR